MADTNREVPEDVLLSIENLHVSFVSDRGEVQAVRGVNLQVKKGEVLAVVGESGCGKSVTSQSVMRLLPPATTRYSGSILLEGRNLLALSEAEMRRVRGREVGMVFQDPMTALNPTMKVGKQIAESIQKHHRTGKAAARSQAVELLRLVGIPEAEKRARQYPHEFSGGMRQRVVLALALACRPKLLIADEPTTALDVTIQAQILDLMNELRRQLGMAIILITHDLGVVANIADRVAVMYAGEVVEIGTVEEVFQEPRHPYTWGLLESVPDLEGDRSAPLHSIPGQPPDLLSPPPGCPFADRCEWAMAICREAEPEATHKSDTHQVRCWLEHPLAPPVEPRQSGERRLRA